MRDVQHSPQHMRPAPHHDHTLGRAIGMAALVMAVFAAVALLLLYIGMPPANADEGSEGVTVRQWVLPNGGTADNVTWPQTPYDASTPIACGTTVTIQNDVYPYATPEDVAKVEGFYAPEGPGGSSLAYGEDHHFVKSWWFTTLAGPVCEEAPPVTPETPAVPPAAPDVPVAAAPVPAPAPAVAAPAPTVEIGTPATLAATGIDGRLPVSVAVLLVIGTGLVLLGRRRA